MDGGACQAAVHGVPKSRIRATSLSLFTFMHWRRKWQPTSVFLHGESQGRGSLVGCHMGGRTESDTPEATQQQQQQLCIFYIKLYIFLRFFRRKKRQGGRYREGKEGNRGEEEEEERDERQQVLCFSTVDHLSRIILFDNIEQ